MTECAVDPRSDVLLASPDEGVSGFGSVGHARARLLAGPAAPAGAEPLAAHLARLGPVPPERRGRALLELVSDCGLGGRGGADFPTATKMATVASAPGRSLVVVNASESEPASFKDRTLVRLRPHVVIDGAVLAAEAVDADEVVIQLHRGDRAGHEALQRALAERSEAGIDRVAVRISLGPDRFVAGESSAVVAFLEGAPAKPRPGRRAALSGVHGRPTLVQNAETVAHIALAARRGASWFRQAGTKDAPGSVLVTVHGDVARPGTVLEVWGEATIGELVAEAGPDGERARVDRGDAVAGGAVLVGGYGGTWVDRRRAQSLPLWRDALAQEGIALGCGVLGVIASDRCGVAETAGILTYLAGESAGQCGPCAFGLPELAASARALAAGRLSWAGRRRMPVLAEAVAGRGGCAHPDGAVALLESALAVFADDVRRHVRRRPCPGVHLPPALPLPVTEEGWR